MSTKKTSRKSVNKRTTAKVGKKSDRKDPEEVPTFVAGGAPRRWASAASGEGDCDKGPELVYHRHPFSTYDDPRNLSGVQGEQAMFCILAQTASRPPRRRAPPPMDYSGLLQSEHFVLVPLTPAAPAHQPPRGLQKELSDADLSRGYMPSRVGGRMAFDKPQDLGRQAPQHADDRKMPAETPERAAEAALFSHFIASVQTMPPSSATHPSVPSNPLGPYPSSSRASNFGKPTSKKRGRTSLSNLSPVNERDMFDASSFPPDRLSSFEKGMFDGPSPPPQAAAAAEDEPPRAKRSRPTNEREEESFVLKLRTYTDQFGVTRYELFQEGDPTPKDISSVEDEHAFTIGKTGVKQPRKGRVGGRKGRGHK